MMRTPQYGRDLTRGEITMPMTAAETHEWDENVTSLGSDVVRLASVTATLTGQVGPDKAIAEMYLHFAENDYTWDEIALLLAVALTRVPAQTAAEVV